MASPEVWAIIRGKGREEIQIYKLIAIDIDGTLINTNMELTVPTRRAIALAREKGIEVTLATGRSFHSAKHYADRLKLDPPLICSNGAIIRRRQGDILLESSLDSATILPLLAEMRAAGLYSLVYHNRGIFASANSHSLSAWMGAIGPAKAHFSRLYYSLREYFLCRVRRLPSLSEGAYIGHKVFTAGPAEELSVFQQRATALGLSVDFYPGTEDCMYLEITAPGISKGWALAKLAEHLGIGMEAVVAIGDNLNDHSMIQAAGLGVVMGNGHSLLKEVAGEVTASNDQDGVAAAIHQLILPASAAKAG